MPPPTLNSEEPVMPFPYTNEVNKRIRLFDGDDELL